MIAPFIVVAIVVATLVAIAARAADALARLWRRPARDVWSAAIVLALGVPGALLVVRAPGAAPAAESEVATTAASGLRILPTFVVEARSSVRHRIDVLVERLAPLDGALGMAWIALSLGVVLLLVRGVRALHAARPTWRARDVDGERVLVAPDVGPAVVGIVEPTIVLPEWVLALDAPLRALVLRHEREHVNAGDPRHLALGALGIALMPWNPALWWMLRRQRTALEIDCDARVLAARPDVPRYGLLLLAVAQRRATPIRHLAGAPALAESTSDLSKRIEAMRSPLPRRRAARTALGAAIAAIAIVAAIAACSAGRDLLAPSEQREAPRVVEFVPMKSPANRAAQTVHELPTVTTTPSLVARRTSGTMMKVRAAAGVPAAQRGSLRAKRPMVQDGPYFEFQVEQPVAPAPGTPGPRYPDELKAAGVEGEVLAQFVVDTLGHVEMSSFKVLKSDDDRFTQAVTSALANMRMQPALVGGRPVKQLVQQPFYFRLSK